MGLRAGGGENVAGVQGINLPLCARKIFVFGHKAKMIDDKETHRDITPFS